MTFINNVYNFFQWISISIFDSRQLSCSFSIFRSWSSLTHQFLLIPCKYPANITQQSPRVRFRTRCIVTPSRFSGDILRSLSYASVFSKVGKLISRWGGSREFLTETRQTWAAAENPLRVMQGDKLADSE